MIHVIDFERKLKKLEEHIDNRCCSIEKRMSENKKSDSQKIKKLQVDLEDINHVVFELKNYELDTQNKKISFLEEKLIQELEKMEKKVSMTEKIMLQKVEEQQKQIDHLLILVKNFEHRIEELTKDVSFVKEELKTKISIHPNYFDDK